MSHVHEYRKHIGAEDEQLPAADGSVVTYVGTPKGDFDVVERFGGPTGTVTLTGGMTSPDGVAGTIIDQTAEFKYGWHMVGGGNDSGPYVAKTTKCRVAVSAGSPTF